MRRRRWPAAVPVLLLAGLCAGLGWQVRQQLKDTHVPALAQAKVKTDVGEFDIQVEVKPPPKVEMPGVGAFDAVVARNLFSSKREPPPLDDGGESKAPVAASLDLTLTGVVIAADDRRVAILNEPAGQGVLRLSPGDRHQGWQLTEIRARRATFQRGGETQTLEITFGAEGAGPGGRAQPGRAPQQAGSRGNYNFSVQPSRADAQGNPQPAARQRTIRERRQMHSD